MKSQPPECCNAADGFSPNRIPSIHQQIFFIVQQRSKADAVDWVSTAAAFDMKHLSGHEQQQLQQQQIYLMKS